MTTLRTTPATPNDWDAALRTVDALRARAAAHRDAVQARARHVWAQAFGGRASDWDGSIFLYANNWSFNAQLTPAQRRACKYILHLQRTRLFEASRIVDRIAKRVLFGNA